MSKQVYVLKQEVKFNEWTQEEFHSIELKFIDDLEHPLIYSTVHEPDQLIRDLEIILKML